MVAPSIVAAGVDSEAHLLRVEMVVTSSATELKKEKLDREHRF